MYGGYALIVILQLLDWYVDRDDELGKKDQEAGWECDRARIIIIDAHFVFHYRSWENTHKTLTWWFCHQVWQLLACSSVCKPSDMCRSRKGRLYPSAETGTPQNSVYVLGFSVSYSSTIPFKKKLKHNQLWMWYHNRELSSPWSIKRKEHNSWMQSIQSHPP